MQRRTMRVRGLTNCFTLYLELDYILLVVSYHRLNNSRNIQHENYTIFLTKIPCKYVRNTSFLKSTKKLIENKSLSSFYKKSFGDFIARTDLAGILIYWWRLQHQTPIDRVLAACNPFAIFINNNIFIGTNIT